MCTRHKHADLIIAWANNPELKFEARRNSDGIVGSWVKVDEPNWCTSYEYRIKPKPPVVKFGVLRTENMYNAEVQWNYEGYNLNNIEATFCPDSGALLSIEKI